MVETDPMTINERRKYIHKIWGRYRDSSKQEKSLLLDEAAQITGLHRKSILRILNGHLSRKPRTKNRGKAYGPTVAYAVRKLAISLDYAQPPLDRLLAFDLVDKSRLLEVDKSRMPINPLLLREKKISPFRRCWHSLVLVRRNRFIFYKTRLNVKEPSVTLSFELTEVVR